MAQLRKRKKPVVVRVQTEERVEEILEICDEHGREVIIGIEPDEPEDISDLTRLLNPSLNTSQRSEPKVGRNDPCPCGSGLKYKKCCLKKKS
jgi:SWIM/SEC-C metal-binding protein